MISLVGIIKKFGRGISIREQCGPNLASSSLARFHWQLIFVFCSSPSKRRILGETQQGRKVSMHLGEKRSSLLSKELGIDVTWNADNGLALLPSWEWDWGSYIPFLFAFSLFLPILFIVCFLFLQVQMSSPRPDPRRSELSWWSTFCFAPESLEVDRLK